MSSMKKGFKAPVLVNSESSGEKLVNSEASDKNDKAKDKIKENKGDLNSCKVDGPSKSKKLLKKNIQDEKASKGEVNVKSEEGPKREKKSKKPEKSLTDSQYEDIFESVLTGLKSNPNSQLNTPDNEDCKGNEEKTPVKQKGDGQKSNNNVQEDKAHLTTPKKKTPEETDSETPKSQHKPLSQSSVWGSHYRKNPSQVSSLLKDFQESQKSLVASGSQLSSDTTSSSSDAEEEGEEDEEAGVLASQNSVRQSSQVSRFGAQNPTNKPPVITTDQRTRLEHLQQCRNVGLWVFCCRPSCEKQRYLANVTDPQDVPELWYCHMNPDPKYNHCNAEEQKLTEEEEDDMIYNQFTAGSVVWARVAGYPWWPAMVDDDPDLEQYYWLEEDLKTVTYYHVVFFDENTVTRAWVSLKNISPYCRHENKYKTTIARGLDYKHRIMVAKEQANDAATLTTQMRLKVYSFIARYKGAITTSAQKVKQTMAKYKLKVKVPKKKSSAVNISPEKETKSSKKKMANQSRKKEEVTHVANTHKEKRVRNNSVHIEKEEKSIQNKENRKPAVNEESDDTLKRKLEEDSDTEISLPLKKKRPKSMFEKKVEKLMKKRKPRSGFKTDLKKGKTNTKDGLEEACNKTVDFEKAKGIPPKKKFKKSHEPQENTTSKFSKEEPVVEPVQVQESLINVLSSPKSNKSTKSKNENSNCESPAETKYEEVSKESSVENSLFVDTSKPQPNVLEEVNTQKEPEPQPSVSALVGSETPSGMPFNTNNHQKNKPLLLSNTEDSLGSFIEPSQPHVVERDELQEEKHSQSTIADFMANLSEDAVVPEAPLSQLSEPFEE